MNYLERKEEEFRQLNRVTTFYRDHAFYNKRRAILKELATYYTNINNGKVTHTYLKMSSV